MTNPDTQPEGLQPGGIQFFTPVSLGILAQMFFAGLVIAATAMIPHPPAPGIVRNVSRADSGAVGGRPNESESGGSAAATERSSDLAEASPASPLAATETEPEPARETETETATNTNAGGAAPGAAASVTNAPALDDVRQKGRVLPLAGEGLSDRIELCRIDTQDPAAVSMELVGGEFAGSEQMTLQLKASPADAQAALWKVSQEATRSLARKEDIGEFSLKGQQLSFHWFRNADKGKLPFCRLRISVGTESEICDLWAVSHSGAAGVRLTKARQILHEFVPAGIRLPPSDILQLQLTLENWPEHEISGTKLTFSEAILVTFPDEESGRPLMTVKLLLDDKEGRCALRSEYFFSALNAGSVSSRRGKTEFRYDDRELTEEQLKKSSDSLTSLTARTQRDLDLLQAKLKVLNDRQSQLLQQMTNVASNGVLTQLQTQIAAMQDEEAAFQEILDELEAATSGMEKVRRLCEEIGTKGQIQYRLFRPFAGDGGDVVIASSVTQAAAVEETP